MWRILCLTVGLVLALALTSSEAFRFVPTGPPGGTGTITTITLYWRAKSLVRDGGALQAYIYVDGVGYNGTGGMKALTMSYANFSDTFSGSWTEAEVEAMLGGLTHDGSATQARVTQLYATTDTGMTLRPNADHTDGDWINSDSGAVLYSYIDEAVADDDTTYIYLAASSANPQFKVEMSS